MTRQAVIFDMDGVLIDSEPLWQRAQIACLAQYGATATVEDCVTHTMGKRIDAIAETWCDLHHLSVQPAQLADEIVTMLCHLIDTEGQAMPGVSDILQVIKQKGYRIGLATSSSDRLVDAVMNRLGITSYFDVICSADAEEYGKPNPAVYLTAARKLGVAPNACLVFEDSLNGLIAAKAATITTYLVSEHHQLPKFAFADKHFATLMEAVPFL